MGKVLPVGSDDHIEPAYDERTTAAVELPPAQNFLDPVIKVDIVDDDSGSDSFGFLDRYTHLYGDISY